MKNWDYFIILGCALLLNSCNTGVRVADTFPDDNSEVSATSWIGMEFQTAMQESSVEDRFHIDPLVHGEFHWDESWLWFQPTEPLDPEETYIAHLESGATAQDGRPIIDSTEWHFGVRDPILVYVSIVEDSPALVSISIDQGDENILVNERDILEFVPARDGSLIAIIIENTQGGSDLWRIGRDGSNADLLVDCGPNRCSAPAWSPSGNRIAYSRESANPASISGFDSPRLWTIDRHTAETSELIHDDHVLHGQPSWSPDGRWLAFYDLVLDGIRILDLMTSSEQVLTTGFGLVGSWSPDGNRMIYPVLVQHEDQFLTTLQIVDLPTKTTEVVIGEGMGWGDVGLPRWSPSGEWVAIGALSGEHGEGRQLWLFRPDGTEAHTIVVDPNYTHGGYHWDPWGRRIVFQRFSMRDPGAQPEVVLWEIGGEETVIARNAWLPDWLP